MPVYGAAVMRSSLRRGVALLCVVLVLATAAAAATAREWGAESPGGASAEEAHLTWLARAAEAAAAEEAAEASGVTVQTALGAVVGERVWGGVERWRGIPFAQPPVGELRFAPPQPSQPWGAPLDASAYGPACVQSSLRLLSLTESEDCLYVNVWRRRGTGTGAAVPVMVWVHGGGYHNGAASIYWPEKLLRAAPQPVVFVSIQYRLGALGFLALNGSAEADGGAPPLNVGLQDQQAALRWVQENIAAFGGDPARVLLFGESAGGSSAGYFHLVLKESAGLFSRALLESPGPATYKDVPQSEAESAKFVASAGCDDGSPAQQLACLRALPLSSLKRARHYALSPAVGYASVPDQPIRMLARGAVHDVPLVVGVNAAEGDMFVEARAGPPPMSDAAYATWMRVAFPDRAVRRFAQELYAAERERFGNWRALSSAFGDQVLTCGAQLALNASLHLRSPVRAYVFTQRSPYAARNVTHGSELPYVFGRYQRFTDDDRLAVQRVGTWWVNMAATGDPNSPAAQPDGALWPRYDPTTLAPSVMNVRGRWENATALAQLLPPFEHSRCAAWNAQVYSQLPPRA